MLEPEALVNRWVKILRAAQRYVRQLPADQLNLRATHNRGRQLQVLSQHIFNVGDAYLMKCAAGRAKELSRFSGARLEKDSVTSAGEISSYGDGVISRIELWWNGLADKACEEKIETPNYGVLSIHQLLERATWHSAHHTRQIVDVLQRQGIVPDGEFNDDYLAGLPMPKRTWD